VEGDAVVGATLTAKVTPSGATVNYQWQASADDGTTWDDIADATSKTYILSENEVGKLIRVKVTGTGNYTGTKTSDPVGPVTAGEEPEPVASTYKFSYEVPADVVAGQEVEVPVTFKTDVKGDIGYEGVRFKFTAQGPGDVTFKAVDSNEVEHTFTNEGYWGPPGGFDLPAEYEATTDWTLVFSAAGEYTITFSLIDADTEEVIAGITETVEITVAKPEPVASTYKFSYEVPADVVAGQEVEVPVTFKTDVKGDIGYEGVRFKFTAQGPGDVTFKAVDSNEVEHTFTNEGYWGPPGGFDLPAEYEATTDWTLVFSAAGEYTITFSLIDADTEEVIAGITETVEITVAKPEPVASTYKFSYEVPADVVAGQEVEVPVTFKTDVKGDIGYEGVRFKFTAQGPGDVTFKAVDSNEVEHTFTNEGYWGPPGGFDLPAEYEATTDWTLVFSEAGDYTITFSLIDADTEEVIAGITDSVTIEVEKPVEPSKPVLEVTGPDEEVPADAENFTVTFVATHDKGLAYLEIDHNLGKHGELPAGVDTLPEFKLYPDAANPWGSDEEAAQEAARYGVSATYDADNTTWTVTFGGDALKQIRTLTAQYTGNKFKIYSLVCDVDGVKSGSMYDGTYETTIVTLAEKPVEPSKPVLEVTGPDEEVPADAENFTVTFVATHDKELAYLEIDHNLGKHGELPAGVDTLPEFKLYPDEDNPWGSEEAAQEAAMYGVSATYDATNTTWTVTFGGDALKQIRTLTAQYTGNKFKIYSLVCDVEGVKSGSMYDGTYETTIVTLAEKPVEPSKPVLKVTSPTEEVPADAEDFEVTFVATHDKELAYLEIDHNLGKHGELPAGVDTLPEFKLYPDAANPWGSDEEAAQEAARYGVSATYDADNTTWTVTFGGDALKQIRTLTAQYTGNKFKIYSLVCDVEGVKSGSMYDGTYETTIVTLAEKPVEPSKPVLEVTGPDEEVPADAENFTVTFVATHDKGLAYLEIDHNLGKHGELPAGVDTLPEFKLYPDAANPWGSEEAAQEAEDYGVSATYDAANTTWTVTFGGEALKQIRTLTAQYTGNKFKIYSLVCDVDGVKSGSMYDGTYETTIVTLVDPLQEVIDGYSISVSYEAGTITAEFDKYLTELPAGLEGYKIDVLITLGAVLPEGTEIEVRYNDGDPLPLQDNWRDNFNEANQNWLGEGILDIGGAKPFVGGEPGKWTITISGNEEDINTTVKIESAISNDKFETWTVIADAQVDVVLAAEKKEYHTYKFEIKDLADKYIVSEGLANPSDENFEGLTPVKLSIVVDENKDKAYEGKVRVAPVGANGLQLWAKDSQGKWYDINVTGWGPPEGFVINPEFVTPVYVIVTEAFDETVTLSLVDVTGDYGAEDNIIISQEVAVKAVVSEEEVLADIDKRILEAIDMLDFEGTGIGNITYADKHAVFTIGDLNTDIVELANSGVIEIFQEMFKDVSQAVIKIDGEVVGTIENPAGMTEGQLKLAIAENLIYPLIEGADTRNLIELVGKSASAEITIKLGEVEYTATYSVEFVAGDDTVFDDIDARIEESIEQLNLEGTGISNIDYANRHATFTIDGLNTDIVEFANSGVIEIFQEMFKDVSQAVIKIDGEVVGTIENPAGMTEGQLKLAIAENLIYPLIEGADTRNLIELVGKSASAEITIKLGEVEYTATYSVEFVAGDDTVFDDIDARILEAIDKLDFEGTGIGNITYADKHAVFTIGDLNTDIVEFADSGVIEIFQEMFTDVSKAVISIEGKEPRTIENPAGMTEGELKLAIAENLIYPLIEGADTRNLIELVGKSASAEITIKLGEVEYTATYSVEFVAGDDTVFDDIDARILEAIDKLDFEGTGIGNITYADKHAVFTIGDLNTDIVEFADSGVIEIFQEMFTDVSKAVISIEGKEPRTIENPAGMTEGELKLAIAENLIYPLIEGADTRNLIELVGKSASAEITIKLGEVEYTATYSVEFDGDQAMADAVIDKIDDLPGINELTLADKDAVEAARAAYEDLTEVQKALVTNIEVLKAAEAQIKVLIEDEITAVVTDKIKPAFIGFADTINNQAQKALHRTNCGLCTTLTNLR
jgi:predicted ester cyclase